MALGEPLALTTTPSFPILLGSGILSLNVLCIITFSASTISSHLLTFLADNDGLIRPFQARDIESMEYVVAARGLRQGLDGLGLGEPPRPSRLGLPIADTGAP